MISPAMAAQLAYDPQDTARKSLEASGYQFVQFFECQETEGYVAASDSKVYVAFRGSETILDFRYDLKLGKTAYPQGGEVHSGFFKAAESIFDIVDDILLSCVRAQEIIFTGHSLGGALACISADLLPWNPRAVYLFGCPRVFDHGAAHGYDSRLGRRTFRYVHNNDIVPRIPPTWAGYKHIGRLVYVDRKGRVRWRLGRLDILKDRVIGRLRRPFDWLSDHSMLEYRREVGGIRG